MLLRHGPALSRVLNNATSILTMPSSLRVPLSIASSRSCIWRSWLEPSGNCKDKSWRKVSTDQLGTVTRNKSDGPTHINPLLNDLLDLGNSLLNFDWLVTLICTMFTFLLFQFQLYFNTPPQHKREEVRLLRALVGHAPETRTRHSGVKSPNAPFH